MAEPYVPIRQDVRDVWDEIYNDPGHKYLRDWWTAPNNVLGNFTEGPYRKSLRPCDHEVAALAMLNSLAGGSFM